MPQSKYILSIDQGTDKTKALLFDADGRLYAKAARSHRQIVNEKGWVEHDPEEIYQNMLACVRDVLTKSGVLPGQVLAAGLCNQRETAVMWARNGKPLYNAIVWKCARGAAICTELQECGYAPLIKEHTGLQLSPYFTAAKFHWLLHNAPAVQRYAEKGTLMAGTMDSFLLYRLTHRHVTDYSNASRTQLFNIHILTWDSQICALFDVPLSALPHVRYSDTVLGKSTFDGIFEQPIPICGVMGDAHASLFAQGCIYPGMGKITYNDGASVMINTGIHPVSCDNLVVSLAWGMEKTVQYVLEGNVNYAGALFDWLVDNLEFAPDREQLLALAHSVPDAHGVYLVPAFSGLGAPYWCSSARAQLVGMTLSTHKRHIARAAEESIAYQVMDILETARNSTPLKSLCADGSLAEDSALMQFQTDLLRMNLSASAMPEPSAAGAAFAAGLTVGFYTPAQLERCRRMKAFSPHMRDTQAAALYNGWHDAISHLLSTSANSLP